HHVFPPLLWDVGDAVAAFGQGFPQQLWMVDVAGQATAHPDDRHRLPKGGKRSGHRVLTRHIATDPHTVSSSMLNRWCRALTRSARESPGLANTPRWFNTFKPKRPRRPCVTPWARTV